MSTLKIHSMALFGLLLCAVFVSCPRPPGPRVSLETGREATAAIGAEGGTLEATAADGTVYTLTIPPHGVAAPATIKMTPVTEIADLPLAGGLAGGRGFAAGGAAVCAARDAGYRHVKGSREWTYSDRVQLRG